MNIENLRSAFGLRPVGDSGPSPLEGRPYAELERLHLAFSVVEVFRHVVEFQDGPVFEEGLVPEEDVPGHL